MVKRRSLDEALSPEEAKFFGVETKPSAPSINPQPEKKEELPMPKPVSLKESFTQESPPPSPPSTVAQGGKTSAGTGAINARIDPRITTALLRASVDRRIAGLDLSTQREIIADALTDWLKKHRYFK